MGDPSGATTVFAILLAVLSASLYLPDLRSARIAVDLDDTFEDRAD